MLTTQCAHRFLSDSIHRYILDPANLPTALRNLRGGLFPNNAMGIQTLFPPESDQELRALRRKCASALWALVPRSVGRLYFGGSGSFWLAAAWSTTNSSSATPGFLAAPAIASQQQRSGPATTDDTRNRSNNAGGGGGEGLARGGAAAAAVAPPSDADMLAEIETDILDVFSDPYCNKHLMYGALELILVRLMPELAEKGVAELWEERLS